MANKARIIKEVKNGGIVIVTDEFGYERELIADRLARPELMAAAAVMFQGANHPWNRTPNDQIIEALRTGMLPKLQGWDELPATTAQRKYMVRLGIEIPYQCTKQQAHDLIDAETKRRGIPTKNKWNGPKNNDGGFIEQFDMPTPMPTPTTPASDLWTPTPANVDLSDYVTHTELGKVKTAILTRMGSLDESIESIADQVNNMRPVVYQVKLGDLPEIEIKELTHEVFPTVLKRVARRRNVYLCGPAGTGKSFIAEQVAKTLGMEFGAISVSGGTTKSDIFGFMNAAGNYVETEFRKRFEFGGVFCIDEIDSGNPNVLTGINQALAGSVCAFPDGMVRKHEEFICIATANTYGTGATKEYIGRNPIDFATLNRFMKIDVPIDERIEDMMVGKYLDGDRCRQWLDVVRTVRANVDRYGIHAVVSPRDAENGAVALVDGSTVMEACQETFLFGQTPENVVKMLEGVNA